MRGNEDFVFWCLLALAKGDDAAERVNGDLRIVLYLRDDEIAHAAFVARNAVKQAKLF